MKRSSMVTVLALTMAASSVYGAQCQGPDGKWYDYSSPECSGSSSASQAAPAPSTSRDDRQASLAAQHQMLVRAHLKDPGSAEFSSVRLLSNGSGCGYVNAKNSYGGYTGSQLYLVMTAGGRTHVLIGKDVYGSQIQVNGVWVSSDYYIDQCLTSGRLVY